MRTLGRSWRKGKVSTDCVDAELSVPGQDWTGLTVWSGEIFSDQGTLRLLLFAARRSRESAPIFPEASCDFAERDQTS